MPTTRPPSPTDESRGTNLNQLTQQAANSKLLPILVENCSQLLRAITAVPDANTRIGLADTWRQGCEMFLKYITELHETVKRQHHEKIRKSVLRGVAGNDEDPFLHLYADVNSASNRSARSERGSRYRRREYPVAQNQIDKKIQQQIETLPYLNREHFDSSEALIWLRTHSTLRRLEERKEDDHVADLVWRGVGEQLQTKVPQLLSDRTFKTKTDQGPWELMQIIYASISPPSKATGIRTLRKRMKSMPRSNLVRIAYAAKDLQMLEKMKDVSIFCEWNMPAVDKDMLPLIRQEIKIALGGEVEWAIITSTRDENFGELLDRLEELQSNTKQQKKEKADTS